MGLAPNRIDPGYADFVDAFKHDSEKMASNMKSRLVLFLAYAIAVACAGTAMVLYLAIDA
jgi:hypothetical protein